MPEQKSNRRYDAYAGPMYAAASLPDTQDYRKSSNKLPGAYLQKLIVGWGLNRGGGGLFRGRLISKFSIFPKGLHKNDMIFLTNLTKNYQIL